MRFRVGSKDLIKDINRYLVIREIMHNGPISRTDISKRLNMGLSTITNITEEFLKVELIHEIGEGDSSGGRKPILVKFNSNYGYVIGIKIEENNAIIALTNLSGEIISKEEIPFKQYAPSEEVINIIVASVVSLKKAIPPSKNLFGIGIGVSGLIDQKKGILVYSGMLKWKNVPIGKILNEKFDVSVFVDNDVNIYTMAELWYGHGKNLDNFLVVTYGAGIGSGIIINRKLYNGDFGGAGEIGHMVLVAGSDRKCECGRNGCLEAYSGEAFLNSYIKENIQFYNDSIIDIKQELSVEKVYEYAKKGDVLAINTLKLSAKYLGYGILSVINLLNVSTIVLAGEGMVAKDMILPIVNHIVKDNFFHEYREVKIKVSELGNDAWVIGAATLAVSKLFEMPIYERKNNPNSGKSYFDAFCGANLE